jgi:hypothetical protein
LKGVEGLFLEESLVTGESWISLDNAALALITFFLEGGDWWGRSFTGLGARHWPVLIGERLEGKCNLDEDWFRDSENLWLSKGINVV